MFRYGKIIDSNAKVSRSDRFAEMSKQQRLIEQKKQEIKAKFEERRRQEAEEALKKLANKTSVDGKVHKNTKAVVSSRMQSWKNDERWRKKPNVENEQDAVVGSNTFSNDGSFIEEFRKITQDGDKAETKCKEMSKVTSNISAVTPSNTVTSQLHQPSVTYNSSNTSFSSSTAGMNFQPPFSPNLNYHPYHQAATNATVQNFNHPFYPNHVVHNQFNLSNYRNAAPISRGFNGATGFIPPSYPQPFNPSVSVPALSQQQYSNRTCFDNQPPIPSCNTIPYNQTSRNDIDVTDHLNPQLTTEDFKNDITSEKAEEYLAKRKSDTSCTVSKSDIQQEDGTEKIVRSDSDSIDDVSYGHDDNKRNCIDGSDDNSKNGDNDEEDNDNGSAASPKKTIVKHDEELEKMTTIARIVAECGDHMEEVFLQRSENAEQLHFLTDKFSPPYIAYRHMVDKFRKENKFQECETENDNYDKANDDESERNKYRGNMENFNSAQYTTKQDAEGIVDELKRSTDNSSATENRKTSKVPADDDSDSEDSGNDERRRRKKRRSRWAPESNKIDLSYDTADVPFQSVSTSSAYVGAPVTNTNVSVTPTNPHFQIGQHVPIGPTAKNPLGKLPGVPSAMISQVTRTDSALVAYALQAYGKTNLTEEEWNTAEDHYKLNLLYQDLLRKREEIERLNAAGKNKYEYDSDEDTRGGTWEHKLRVQEMMATQLWADELTEKAKGKHHIGDFLPPDELERFMEKYDALKEGREPDLSDYKEYKLKQDNVGFQMLQKLGWIEGQGLGSDGAGMLNPVNKAPSYMETHGLGIEKPDEVNRNDDEYDAYRKRMMLAYRFRPNPLNNPRRPYY